MPTSAAFPCYRGGALTSSKAEAMAHEGQHITRASDDKDSAARMINDEKGTAGFFNRLAHPPLRTKQDEVGRNGVNIEGHTHATTQLVGDCFFSGGVGRSGLRLGFAEVRRREEWERMDAVVSRALVGVGGKGKAVHWRPCHDD